MEEIDGDRSELCGVISVRGLNGELSGDITVRGSNGELSGDIAVSGFQNVIVNVRKTTASEVIRILCVAIGDVASL